MSDAAQSDVDDVWGAALAEQGGVITDAQPAPMRNLDADAGAARMPARQPRQHSRNPGHVDRRDRQHQGRHPQPAAAEPGLQVVELNSLAGEPLDVLVNGTLIAHGEVVVVNEKFGIRLTDVISAHERVRKLS